MLVNSPTGEGRSFHHFKKTSHAAQLGGLPAMRYATSLPALSRQLRQRRLARERQLLMLQGSWALRIRFMPRWRSASGSVQGSKARLVALVADLVGGHDDLHALCGYKVAHRLPNIATRRRELNIIGLSAQKYLRLGRASLGGKGFLVVVHNIERQLVAISNELPMLFARVDNVPALGTLGPFTVGVSPNRDRIGEAENQGKCTQHGVLLG